MHRANINDPLAVSAVVFSLSFLPTLPLSLLSSVVPGALEDSVEAVYSCVAQLLLR